MRSIARRLYEVAAAEPIVSAHGHVDAGLLAGDHPFTDPASLFVTPDHYVTRLLHADGVPLAQLGLPRRDGILDEAPARSVWRVFCERWRLLAGTPTRLWTEAVLAGVFGVDRVPSARTADALFDELCDLLARPENRPRALYHRFGVEVLATTDDACSDLEQHDLLAADPAWHGRVIPTFRPDPYLDASQPGWADRLTRLATCSGCDTSTYGGYLEALEHRRHEFAARGATSADHGVEDARCDPLPTDAAARIFAAARRGDATAAEHAAFRRHMLFEMARMSCDDGLVMQLHCGVLRNHHEATFALHGPDTGHDIPVATEFTRALRPMLRAFGTHPRFRLVVYTVDESTWARELAPLAGFYPSVHVGAPWWFLDTPAALRRFREAVTGSAGFVRTAGFVDDTRAFCSIPARHDVARRVDCGHLASLVADHVLDEDEAASIARDLAARAARRTFRLG